MMVVAAYARVSSEKQAEARTIESQVDRIREYAREKGHHLDSDMIFVDNGISGATLIRPALDELRDRAVRGSFNKLFVLSPDRLARKSAHQLILVEEFAKLGVELCFVNRELSDSPEDQLLLQIQGVISEYEREKIAERMRRGRIYKAKQGKVNVLAKAPYGYVYIKRTESSDARYEIHPEEAKIAKQIFRDYAYKRMSLGKIIRALYSQGIAAPNGGPHWSTATLHGMLTNPAYVGRAAVFRRKVVPREMINKTARERNSYPRTAKTSPRRRPESDWITIPVPAIIDEKTWQIVKTQKEENLRLAPRNNKKHIYLLSSLAHCEECGYSIYGITPSRLRYADRGVYRCGGMDNGRHPQGKVCSQRPILLKEIDDAVWEQVKLLLLDPARVLEEYTGRNERGKSRKVETKKLINKKALEIRHQEHEKQRLLDLYQHGSVDLKEIEERINKIRLHIKKIESEIAMLNDDEMNQAKTLRLVESLKEFGKKLKLNLSQLTAEEKRTIVRLVVKKIVVNAKRRKVRIEHILAGPNFNRLHSHRLQTTQSLRG